MDRQVAVGGASGFATSLALNLLRGLLVESPLAPLDPVLTSAVLDCPATLNFEEFPVGVFLLGILVGLLFGPVLDLCWLVRQRWRRFVLRQFALESQPRALHRVLE